MSTRKNQTSDGTIGSSELMVALNNHKLFLKGQPNGRLFMAKGVSFARRNLSEQILVGAVVAGADFSHARLMRTNLRGADLFGANLASADLMGGCLRQADLRGANLVKATLRGADFRNADLRPGQLMFWVGKEQRALDKPVNLRASSSQSQSYPAAEKKFTHSDGVIASMPCRMASRRASFVRAAAISETFYYDEIENPGLIKQVFAGQYDAIDNLKKLYSKLNKESDIEEIRKVVDSAKAPQPSISVAAVNRSKLAEVHCAAILFREDGAILIGRGPSTKRNLQGK